MNIEDENDELTRLDVEWLALNAVRETLGIANRGAADSTYSQALAWGRQLLPRLFDPEFSLIAAAQEPPLVREFRQRSEAESLLQNKTISPLELIEKDIEHYEKMIEVSGKTDQLKRALRARYRAKEHFEERFFTEHAIITRDVYTATRHHLPAPPKAGPSYVEFPLPFERALRIRVLHPDKPEHSTGADLIYEFCDEHKQMARVALVQYKIWDGHSLRFSSAGGLKGQIQRLRSLCCTGGLCRCEESVDDAPPSSYRLPYCAAFLRPTDRLQKADATLLSSGLHVPVCVAASIDLESSGGRVLRRDPLRSKAVSQRLFEELFHRSMLGSRWLAYKELELLYRDHEVITKGEHLVVHAQELPE